MADKGGSRAATGRRKGASAGREGGRARSFLGRGLRGAVLKLLDSYVGPEGGTALLDGLAALRRRYATPEESSYLQLVALRWLLGELVNGRQFPSDDIGPLGYAVKQLFGQGPTARDVMALLSCQASGVTRSRRLDTLEAHLDGALVGCHMRDAAELFREAVGFAIDSRPICVLSSSTPSRPHGEETADGPDVPLTVAEGELLTIGGLICMLQYAYPAKRILPLVAAHGRCDTWHTHVQGANAVCIGADNSNAATHHLLQYMRPDDQPAAWVRSDRRGYFINVPGRRKKIRASRDGESYLDGAVAHLRAEHHYGGAGGRVCLLAGITTYGTATAAAAMTDAGFLYHLASQPRSSPATWIVQGSTSGLGDIWPVGLQVVWPNAWPARGGGADAPGGRP